MTSYQGQVAVIPLGAGGMMTDNPHTAVPGTKLFRARNLTMNNGALEKDFGSMKFNQTAVPSGIRQIFDWHPTTLLQKFIVVANDGRVHRFKQFNSSIIMPPEIGGPTFLKTNEFVTMSEGGAEETNKDKKLFILDGQNVPQVIVADATTRRDILAPAADWTGPNQPFKMFLHRSKNYAFGNKNSPHRLYITSALDHEDFTGGKTFDLFPGESERIIDHFVFKGRLFILKFPNGLYFVDDVDPDPGNWTATKINGDFGASSPQSAFFVKDDILVPNNYGSVTSVIASDTLGDLKSADLYANLRVEGLVRNELSQLGGAARNAIYYQDKKEAYITYRSPVSNQNDRMIKIDFTRASPEIILIDKDQPTCIALRRDERGILRPMYGADDGFIYFMDRENRNVGGNAFRAEFQTHNLDFSQANVIKGDLQKQFDFIEFVYEPTGNFDVNFEIFIDGKTQKTGTFKVVGRSTLGVIKTGSGETSAKSPFTEHIPIGGQGRRISIKCYNDVVDQNFKLLRINVFYKETGNQRTTF